MRHVISLVMRSIWLSFFISERSEFKLIGNGYAGAAFQNGCGPERKSGGDANVETDEERRCRCRDRSGK